MERTLNLQVNELKFNKARKTLSIPHNACGFRGGFPDVVNVFSPRTNRTVKFVVDVEAGMDHEFWDGEQCQYMPVEQVATVESLTIYNC
jgi:hypothetical protein